MSQASPEFSVSEISAKLKGVVEDIFSYVKVRGEISGLKVATSGHVYFNLKDANALIACAIWRGSANALPFKLEEGAEIVCTGKISTYPLRSTYQLIVSKAEAAGIGALLAMLDARKKKLEAEGLFHPSKKKSIPLFPNVIGVITSPTGAVIRDIIHRVSERYPLNIIVWPVLVQGTGAAEQIANAIRGFNNLPDNITKPDVLIVARGGGSIEDLWSFNEEIVVRAAADSVIPIISAVGHETDTTLIDYVSDKRAPTPTAAAEMATPVLFDLIQQIDDYTERLNNVLPKLVQYKSAKLNALPHLRHLLNQLLANHIKRFDGISTRFSNSLKAMLFVKNKSLYKTASGLRANMLLGKILDRNQSKLNLLSQQFDFAWNKRITSYEQKLSLFSQLHESFHYKKVLKRGFAIVHGKEKLVTSVKAAEQSANLSIEFYDGTIQLDK